MNWSLLQNSLLVAGGTAALATLLGFAAALFTSGLSKGCRIFVFVIATVAIVLPPFLVTNCWLYLFGINGAYKSWLPFSLFSLPATILIFSLFFWPIAMFTTLVGWRKLEPAQLEIDPLLRGSRLIRWLLIPAVGKELALAGVMIFILAVNQFSVPAILQVKVLPAELWVSFNTSFNYASAFKLGWPLVVIPALMLFAIRSKVPRWTKQFSGISAKQFRSRLGMGWFAAAAVLCLSIVFLSALLPTAHLVLSRATWDALLPALQAGKGAVLHSFLFAAATACVVVPVAILCVRRSTAAVSWFFFLIPGVVLGISLISIVNRPALAWFYQGTGIVICAFAFRYFAPAWTLIAQAFKSTDRNLTDAARLEGAKGWTLLRHAYLPQLALPLCVAWYATYLFCLWDVETLVLIIPPGKETAALRVFGLLHYGYNPQVNALCLVLLVVGALPLLLFAAARVGRQSIRNVSTLVAGIGLLGLSGCSQSNGSDSSGRFSIKSDFFSHVEVIGSRGVGVGQFNKPRSLALDRNDNVYVVDMTGRVQKFSADGKYLLQWQMPQTELGRPKGMGLDSDGNVIVIEPHYSRVNHFSPEGVLVSQWGVHGTNEGQLAFPRSVAINSRGEMYLTEFVSTERVQHFSSRGEKFLGRFGNLGSGNGEFNRPEGICVDAQDRVYVADSCNHRVQVFSSDGTFVKSFGKAGSGSGEMSYPYDVRFDSAGFQYVCEFGNSRIQIFDSKNTPVEILGGAGPAPGQFDNPWSIAFDSKGNLYVADSQNHRVQKFVRKVGRLARSES